MRAIRPASWAYSAPPRVRNGFRALDLRRLLAASPLLRARRLQSRPPELAPSPTAAPNSSELVIGYFLEPGKEAREAEYAHSGSAVLSIPLGGGCGQRRLLVTAHPATDGDDLEWRVLRFTPDQGRSFNLQSVTKVRVPASAASPAALLPEFLPLEYTKYLAAVALAALGALGRTDGPLRLLCIGLGGGSLPAFLAAALPACRVDVVESERVVVEAARRRSAPWASRPPGTCAS